MGEDIDDAVDAAEFDGAQMDCWCNRIVFLEEEATSNNSWNFTQDVPKLDGFDKLYKWLEAIETALQRKRTPGMGIPMSYLIRKEADAIPWADIKEDDPRYKDMDMLLIQTVQLRGPIFKHHNQLLFDNLKNLTIDGNCWQLIQHLKAQNNRNGREAFLLLKQQAKGDEAQKSRNAIRKTILQTGKDRKSSALSKGTTKKGIKWFSRCQWHIPQKWSGGKVGLGTYFGHMELDEFKSKSPKEIAQIKALRDSTKQSNKKPKVSSVRSSVESLVASGATSGIFTIGGQSVSFTVAAATTSTPPATASQAKLGTDRF